MVQVAAHIDQHALAGGDISDQLEAVDIQRDALGGDHVLRAAVGLALAVDRRADAVGVAEAEQAKARDHRHGRVAAATTTMHALNGAEDVVLVDPQAVLRLQLMREHIEQDFRIGLGIDVAQILDEDVLLQLLGVGEVAVVRQHDAVGGVDIERLRLGGTRQTGGRVADMADPHIAAQVHHMLVAEDVSRQARLLAHEQTVAVAGDDTCGVLPAMLQDQQGVVERLVDGLLGDDADDAAHDSPRETSVTGSRPVRATADRA
jgi:hypothetical protein